MSANTMKKYHFSIGDRVLCDLCDKDFTNSEESGGFQFQSKAICPDCEVDFLDRIRLFNETHLIGKFCPENMPFADWVRNVIRDGEPGGYDVIEFDSANEVVDYIHEKRKKT